jgi:uncharacterized membrane protein
MMTKTRTIIKKIIERMWSLFISGLLTLLPITITVALFSFSFQLITHWLKPIQKFALRMPSWLPHPEIFVAIALIMLMGLIVKSFLLQSIIHAVERLFFNIPLVRPVYSGIKQLVHAFNPQDTTTFKKIVFVEFPHKNIYSLGFMTSEVSPYITGDTTKKYYSIFIPTTPNPTSGFCVFIPEESIKVVDLTHQEAMALIISGGIVQPERLNPPYE